MSYSGREIFTKTEDRCLVCVANLSKILSFEGSYAGCSLPTKAWSSVCNKDQECSYEGSGSPNPFGNK